jgi:hypothetical protein
MEKTVKEAGSFGRLRQQQLSAAKVCGNCVVSRQYSAAVVTHNLDVESVTGEKEGGKESGIGEAVEAMMQGSVRFCRMACNRRSEASLSDLGLSAIRGIRRADSDTKRE